MTEAQQRGRLADRVALITGAASGIGRACAERLASEGAAVMITDIQEAAGHATVAAIEEAGGRAAFLLHDVREEPQWQAAVEATERAFDALHVLVNNAGVGLGGSIIEMSLEDFQRQQAINVDGVFLGIKHAIPAMCRAGQGSIINISSVAGMKGAPGLSAYCATKGAVRLLTKSVALECGTNDWPVRVNSVHPGIIDTPIWDTVAPGILEPGTNRVDLDAMTAGNALKRTGQPLDIANGVLFLASDEADYITGTELVIDAGMCA